MSARVPGAPHLMDLVPGSASTGPRLHLEPTGGHQGFLDGGWWPRSRNPDIELPSLVLAIDGLRGDVVRLALSATGWDRRPRRLLVAGRTITLEYHGSQPATLLTAICATGARVDLLVVPPSTAHYTARAAMLAAAATRNPTTTAHLTPPAGSSL